MLKMRRPLGRLIFNMGIAIPGKTVFLIETAPWWPWVKDGTNLRATIPYVKSQRAIQIPARREIPRHQEVQEYWSFDAIPSLTSPIVVIILILAIDIKIVNYTTIFIKHQNTENDTHKVEKYMVCDCNNFDRIMNQNVNRLPEKKTWHAFVKSWYVPVNTRLFLVYQNLYLWNFADDIITWNFVFWFKWQWIFVRWVQLDSISSVNSLTPNRGQAIS